MSTGSIMNGWGKLPMIFFKDRCRHVAPMGSSFGPAAGYRPRVRDTAILTGSYVIRYLIRGILTYRKGEGKKPSCDGEGDCKIFHSHTLPNPPLLMR